MARVLSKLGIASRTEAAEWIRAGRVSVAGRVVRDPERPTAASGEEIRIDGGRLATARRVYRAFHKPSGVLTTRADPRGRPTVYDRLPGDGTWVFPVGRLDGPTTGLLLFTNDSAFSEIVTAGGVPKTYEARVKGRMTDEAMEALRRGVSLDDGPTAPAEVEILSRTGSYTTLRLTIREGKNRQVRRMCRAVGHEVVKLVRVAIGPVGLGDLPEGAARELSPAEVQRILSSARRRGQKSGSARGRSKAREERWT
ncbi:MAG: rRNA pseudouridine synthase [Planctomycetes bacterium]|nr:rRNA pseudouridine synthase [Planctomycetota bacterium]